MNMLIGFGLLVAAATLGFFCGGVLATAGKQVELEQAYLKGLLSAIERDVEAGEG